MIAPLSRNLWSVLRCSYCGGTLKSERAGAACTACGLEFPGTHGGALDLRLPKPRKYAVEFELGTPLAVDQTLRIEPLKANDRPEVDFGSMPVPHHMTRELMSYFPKARSAGSMMLDLGCGDGVHQRLCEAAGFEWVGADYAESSRAPVLADAHALPFADESFECLLSVAAIQLFRYPSVVMKEACRVLKPGGVFLGTVAFLEPFHDNGFYHHTHLGALNSLQTGGFKVERLAPSRDWTGLTAQARMALFPRMPAMMSNALVYPVHLLHRLWWQMGRLATDNPNAREDVRIRNTTGAFSFVARTPGAPA